MTDLRRRIHQGLRKAEAWIDSRELRERAVLGIGVLVVAALFWNQLVLEPAADRGRAHQVIADRLEQELAGLDRQAVEIRTAHETDPNTGLRERGSALGEQIAALDESIRAHTVAMVSPAEMAQFLEEVLRRQSDLRLVRVENLGAESLLGIATAKAQVRDQVRDQDRDREATAAAVGPASVYKHAFEVELEGRYLSTLAYLEALEDLPWGFFWESLSFEVQEHPEGRATLRAYTLSSEEEWIGV